MKRSRTNSLQAPQDIVELERRLPESDVQVAWTLTESMTLLDAAQAFRGVSEAQLRAMMDATRLRSEMVRPLGKLGVSCPGGRLPRALGLMRTKVQSGLSAGNSAAQLLLLLLVHPVMIRLHAAATGLELSELPEPGSLDDAAVRVLAVAATVSRMSVPLLLIGLYREGDPTLDAIAPGQRDLLQEASERISEEGWATYRRWTERETGLEVSDLHEDEADGSEPGATVGLGLEPEIGAAAQTAAADEQAGVEPVGQAAARQPTIVPAPEWRAVSSPDDGALAHLHEIAADRAAQSEVSALDEPEPVEVVAAAFEAFKARIAESAAGAALRLQAALLTGSRPLSGDVREVQSACAELDRLHAMADVHLAQTSDVLGERNAEQTLRALAATRAGRRQVLALLGAQGPADLEQDLALLSQTVQGLLDRWPPAGDADVALSASLQELHHLIVDASAPSADEDDLWDRTEQLRGRLPELRKVVAAANRRRFRLVEPVDTAAPALVTRGVAVEPAASTQRTGTVEPVAEEPFVKEPVAQNPGPGGLISEEPLAADNSAQPRRGKAELDEQSVDTPSPTPKPESAGASATSRARSNASAGNAAGGSDASSVLERAGSPSSERRSSQVPAQVATPVAPGKAAAVLGPAPTPSVTPMPAMAASASTAPLNSDDQHILVIAGALLEQSRLGLAYHLLEEAGHDETALVVRLAALAQHLRSDSGPCALELLEYAELADNGILTREDGHLLSAATLVKAALLTRNTHLAQLLGDLTDQLPGTWARLAQLTTDAVASGALADLDHETADPAALDQAVQAAAGEARRRQETLPRLREHRGKVLLDSVRAPSTKLGAALAIAARNDASGLAEAQRVATAKTRAQIRADVIAEDQKLRQAGKALPSDRIDEITSVLVSDRDAVARWAAAISRANARVAGDMRDWGHGRLVELHEFLSDHDSQLDSDLRSHARSGAFAAGQAEAARRLLRDVKDLVHGRSAPPDVEPSVARVLHMELLKVDGAALDPERDEVVLRDSDQQAKVAALLDAAAELSWEPALQRRLEQDDYDAALRCAHEVDLTLGLDDRATALRSNGATADKRRDSRTAQVQTARPRRLEALKAQVSKMRMLLVQARHSEDQTYQDLVDSKLSELELLLAESDADLRYVRGELAGIESEAARLRQDTAANLCKRLEALVDYDVPEADLARLRQQIVDGDFTAVDDEITNRQQNKRLPVYGRPADLATFFPAVPDALASQPISSVLNKIATGGTLGPLNFADLGGRTDDVVDALRQWRDIGTQLRPGGSGWNRETTRNQLTPVLNRVGLSAPSSSLITLEGKELYGKGWRFLELRDVTRNGKAMVPAFGSLANRRYRLLLAYDVPDVQSLSALREADSSSTPLIVLWFGTLSSAERMDLARSWSDPTMRATIVLDDAALLYVLCAQHGHAGSVFATLMSITLPFTATTPFSEVKRPSVPVEMFYGRDREKRKIESSAGESLLYGGRNMGKSALLRTIKNAAEEGNGERKAVLLELRRDEAFGAAEEIWAELADTLERDGFALGRGLSRSRRQTQVEKTIETWLDENPQAELLLMLDEVDGFFNADAQVNFNETTRLFQLKERNPRLKIVFAGLHSVNHFHGTGNVPFSPAGALSIGPLDPADAYRLLTGPMHAMGYAVAPNEARRIMMHCNYQPYLIQMFAQQLLEALHAQRPEVTSQPPWTFTPGLVTRIMNDPGMRNKINRAFTMTLELDKRFQVIVNLLALNVYEGKHTELSGRELYDDCRQQWPVGFAETSFSSFLELLNELEGLGILGPPRDALGARSLRSSALLPNLGSRSEIELNLAAVADLGLTESKARGLMRPPLDDKGRPGPLTSDQLATVAGRKGNRTCVLVGSPALGLEQVDAALRGRQPALRKIEFASDGGAFRKLLKTGATGETRMTVVSELWKKQPKPEVCQESLRNARSEEYQPEERSAHRAAVLVAGTSNGPWLAQYLVNDPLRDSEVVPMERFTARSLPLQWRDRPKLEDLGSSELAPRVLAVTGGWPALVDQLAQRTLKVGAVVAVAEAEQRLEQPSWPEQFLQVTGVVGVCEDLTRLIGALADHGEPVDEEDLAVLALQHGINNREQAVTLAGWFNLVDSLPDGRLRMAPLIERAWRAAHVESATHT